MTTTFVDGTTVVTASWLNSVDKAVFPSGSTRPVARKVFTGTTAAAQGSLVTVTSGIPIADIISMDCIVKDTNGNYVEQGHTFYAGRQYSVLLTSAGNFDIINSTANSTYVLGQPFTLVVTYFS